ncbi:MAG: 1-acyl-sn-glycerol-3-phosphate acyltransferase [Verrucomicrobia bacterium]|nr:1-acyl-sn-glycerol-3-phosphate acyltransferase [Verrucomicrobiota bacterium]
MSNPASWEAAARFSPLYAFCHVVVRNLIKGYFNHRTYHPERVPLVGPAILAANHVSFGDPPIIGATLPRSISFLARDTLFRPPFFAKLIRTLNAIPIDRDGGGPAGLKIVLSRLELGEAVLLFPEGTRSMDGKVHPARNGIGLLVIRSKVPVVPLRIFGLYEAWGRDRLFPRPHPTVIKYGPAMNFEEHRAEAATASKQRLKVIYDEISRDITSAIERLEPCADVTTFP